MKKSLIVLIAMAFVLALSLPALAEVDVMGTVGVEKDKKVTETVKIDKAHYIGVKQTAAPTHSAEAAAVKNDVNTMNNVTEAPIPAKPQGYIYNEINETWKEDPTRPAVPAVPIKKSATINTGVGDSSAGVMGINQSPGSLNNQGNATSVSMAADGDAFLHAESAAEKKNGVIGENGSGNSVAATEITRENTIDASLKGAAGILGVNQSAGSINNQDNAASLAVGSKSMAALSEADLGMVNSGNMSMEAGVTLTDTLSNGALSGAKGIVGVNQSSGCMNNQANVVAVCAVSFP
ncbi:MAG: hypothetical protein AB1487_12915 [Thermodesulfobacteriota bacterium]